MRSIARVAQRPLHTSIEGNRVKRGLAAGCLFLWYLSFGQAKERYLLPVSHRFGCPVETGHNNLAHNPTIHILIKARDIHANAAEQVIKAHNRLFKQEHRNIRVLNA